MTDQSFWVMVNKQDFLFHGYAEDLAGNRIDFQKPLIFMPNSETDFASIDHCDQVRTSPAGRVARRTSTLTSTTTRRLLADRVRRRPVVRGRPAQDHPAVPFAVNNMLQTSGNELLVTECGRSVQDRHRNSAANDG